MLTLLVNLPSPTKTNTKAGFKRPQPDKFRTHSEYKRGALAFRSERLTDARRTVDGRLTDAGQTVNRSE